MSTFEDRKDTFEKKFAHNEEIQFKVEARTCKLFGLWAAGKMGLNDDESAVYATEVVVANLEEAGYDDIKRKVMPDFVAKNVEISEHIIDAELEKFEEKAKHQIMEETDA